MKSNTDNYDKETVQKARETVDSYLHSNYAGIDSIEFDDDHTHPMGGMTIRGTINDNADFSVDIDDDFVIAGIGEGKGFPDLKDECKDKVCDY